MRRLWCRVWCWTLIASGLFASNADATEPTKLRATVLVPVTEPFMGASRGRFKEEVERETGGSIVGSRQGRLCNRQGIGRDDWHRLTAGRAR